LSERRNDLPNTPKFKDIIANLRQNYESLRKRN